MAQRPDIFTLNASHTLANGLVFAGLGAHAGSTRYHDSSVFGNHGTLMNMDPSSDWTQAIGRSAVAVSGAKYIAVPHSNTLRYSAGKLTYGVWVNTSSITRQTPFGKYYQEYDFFLDNTVSAYYGDASGFTGVSWAATDVRTGTWKHITFCIDKASGSVELFVDGKTAGIQTGTARSGPDILTNDVRIGSRSGANQFVGQLSDPFIYNRIPTTAEIQQLADPSNVMLSGLINPPRRKWWPVVSGAAPTFKAAWATKRRQTIGGGVI